MSQHYIKEAAGRIRYVMEYLDQNVTGESRDEILGSAKGLSVSSKMNPDGSYTHAAVFEASNGEPICQ